MRFFQKLNEPFPDRSPFTATVKSLIGIGIFVALFLFILQPFGINGTGYQMFWACAGFGAVTVVFGLVFDICIRFILRLRSDLPSFTLWKWILQSAVLLLWIAVGNYAFLQLISNDQWSTPGLLGMMWNTLIVGLFPIVFSGIMVQLRAAKRNQGIASGLRQSHPTEKQGPASIPEQCILVFAEAMQNYVALHYKTGTDITKTVERNTLQNTMAQITDTKVVRCHRSYIVNMALVSEVSGNAQGLKLKLTGVDDEIPVSRSYIETVKSYFQ